MNEDGNGNRYKWWAPSDSKQAAASATLPAIKSIIYLQLPDSHGISKRDLILNVFLQRSQKRPFVFLNLPQIETLIFT